MDPKFSEAMRASIVGSARFVEELVETKLNKGIEQYVILGAGLDTFAQRRPEIASQLQVFEVDQPGVQAWKQRRLVETGHVIFDLLKFVPVDFEVWQSWWDQLIARSFVLGKPSLVVSAGVSMFLTKEANLATLKHLANFALGSSFAMTF
jgi:methyltransferase (TIGR00027 family)